MWGLLLVEQIKRNLNVNLKDTYFVKIMRQRYGKLSRRPNEFKKRLQRNAGGWFLPFFHNSKASHEHSEKKNDKGYILSNVSKVKNEMEKEEEYSTTFPNTLLQEQSS